MINTYSLIEMGVTVLSAICAVVISRIHLPQKTAQEIKNILNDVDSGINTFLPGTQISDIANIIEKIVDCGLVNSNVQNSEDKQIIKQSVIEVLKSLNININTSIHNQIDNILEQKTNKQVLPRG